MIAAEDQNFATHNGFDFKAIEKARAHNERAEERARKRNKPVKRIRGASTISQQTAKNLFLWKGQGITRWARKGLEVWYTVLIETLWPKSRIIEVYVNTVELGDGARRHDQQKEGEDPGLYRQRAQRDLLVAEHSGDADHAAVEDREREQRHGDCGRLRLRLPCRGLDFGRHGNDGVTALPLRASR